MYRMNVLVVALSIAASGLSACSRPVTGPSSSAGQTVETAAIAIAGTLWKLQSFQQSGGANVPVSDPERFTLEFLPSGRMSIRADCNQCASSYSLSGETLAVGPNAACTRAACLSAPFDQEYVTALTAATVARVSGNTLECVSPQGVLRFAR